MLLDYEKKKRSCDDILNECLALIKVNDLPLTKLGKLFYEIGAFFKGAVINPDSVLSFTPSKMQKQLS